MHTPATRIPNYFEEQSWMAGNYNEALSSYCGRTGIGVREGRRVFSGHYGQASQRPSQVSMAAMTMAMDVSDYLTAYQQAREMTRETPFQGHVDRVQGYPMEHWAIKYQTVVDENTALEVKHLAMANYNARTVEELDAALTLLRQWVAADYAEPWTPHMAATMDLLARYSSK